MDITTFVILIASFVIIFLRGSVECLRDVELIIPPVTKGQDVQIRCNYNLEGRGLYSITFSKGKQQFYRYLPKDSPPGKTFAVAGVRVNLTLSNEHVVYLTNASLEMSGNYKCVVSAEGSFETIAASAFLTVIVIGDDRPPSLELDSIIYHTGDNVQAMCKTPPSYPIPNVTWYINDLKIVSGGPFRYRVKTDVYIDPLDPLTKSTVSTLSIDLPGSLTSVVRIRCQANVFLAYDKSSITRTIHPQPRRLSGPHTLLRSSSTTITRHSWQSLTILLLLFTSSFLSSLQLSMSTIITCAKSHWL